MTTKQAHEDKFAQKEDNLQIYICGLIHAKDKNGRLNTMGYSTAVESFLEDVAW